MNIILFSNSELNAPLHKSDPRSRHILKVLRRRPGDLFDAGIINGPRGRGTLVAVTGEALELSFVWGEAPPPLPDIRLIIGLPRPQTARDILREGASLGLSIMEFVRTERGEAGYAQSSVWSSSERDALLVAGVAQAFCTRLPEVKVGRSLAEAMTSLPAHDQRFALDNYEAAIPLGQVCLPASGSVTLALGSERGWSAAERELLRQHQFQFAHLGERVLRTETACITAVAVIRAKLGLL